MARLDAFDSCRGEAKRFIDLEGAAAADTVEKTAREGLHPGGAVRQRLIKIVKRAAGILRKHDGLQISAKEGHANFVTDADREVQGYLEKALPRLWPGSRFIGEEKENRELTDEPTWIVDPIDGTTNLIHDYRMSAVSVALCEYRKPILGLIWQPYARELFYAEAGKGAYLNGTPIRVAETPFSEALIAVGTAPYYEELEERSIALAGEFLHSCADIRRSGSAAIDLANIACGRIDGYFELRLKPWDYAAGSLIVEEAGGVFRMPMIDGEPDYDQTTAVVAASPSCSGPMMKIIRKYVSE